MKTFMFLPVLAALLLGACSPVVPATSSGEQPMPVIETEPASVSADVPSTTGYQPVGITDGNVAVEVGVGSPIAVTVDIGGTLPDLCAQVEFVNIVQDGDTFKINVSTTPSTDEVCVRDTGSFRMKLPLNVLDLPVGSYAAEVNGVRANFQLDSSASTADQLRTPEMPIVKRDVQVDNISIDVGLGSPRPVWAVISASMQNGCSQLGEVQMHREGSQFFVRLISYMPAESECNPDPFPIRIELPLNTINLPDGTYEVLVNGATATFEMPLK